MGTKVQIENYLPGDYSMRDLNREANGAGWPSCYNDSNMPNGQFYYSLSPKTIADLHPGYDKDVVKQTILEHEVVFKDQVHELHRLYRVQRDLMDEVRRKEQLRRRLPYETSSSSSPLPSQKQWEEAQRRNGSNFALASPISGMPFISGPDTMQSSPNSAKGKNVQAGPSAYQNCYSPKNSEVSESRPTKYQKGMLDLQLPADEYIDTDEVEQFGRRNDFVNISSSPENNQKRSPGNGKKYLSYPGKMECQGDGPSSDVRFNRPKALADLNEPLHVEETSGFSSVDFLGRPVRHNDVSHRDHPRHLSSSKDISQNSKKFSMNGVSNMQNFRANGPDWSCYAFESEHHKASVRSINQGIQQEKVPALPQPVHFLLDQACQPSFFSTNHHIKGETLKPMIPPHASNQPGSCSNQTGSFHPSDWGTSWVKPNFISQKPASIQTSPFLSGVNLSKSPQSSAQGSDFNKWNLNSTPGANAAFVNDSPIRNGFYQGSSAALKELAARFPPVGYNHVSGTDVTPRKDMNLNVALSSGVSDEYIKPRGLVIIDEDCKGKDPLTVLPWLRGKSVSNNDVASSSCDVHTKAKNPETSRKILGVPIFDNPLMVKQENVAVIDPPDMSGRVKIESSKRKNLFDMNVPCEPIEVDEAVVISKKETELGSIRNNFDLNSCVMEEETETLCASVKVGTGIDLEAPASYENDDVILPVENSLINDPDKQQPETQQDSCKDNEDAELLKLAASAIVAISSQVSMEVTACLLPESSEGDDPLNWFVSIACSSGNDPDIKMVENNELPEGLDDFECMILRMNECTLEEYFPKPSIPDFSIVENSTCALTTRTRRGPGRRGKQKRDFQRDILPGLTTLSRHEVTEDLQTFGGLMRATGYSWQSGPNRTRNGRGRGRRRAVEVTPVLGDTVCALPLKQQQQVHDYTVEVRVEDVSLTGWGKTTRRPRRQRCPAGNPALLVPLT